MVSLQKGYVVSLTKESGQEPLTRLSVGLGWKMRTTAGDAYDLDASAFVCGAGGRVINDQFFVFYHNLDAPDGSVAHQGDNLVGGEEGDDADDEVIQVDLTKVRADVTKIVFAVSIYDAEVRGQNFGEVAKARLRVVNSVTGRELAVYDLAEQFSEETALVFGEVFRTDRNWQFKALGEGYASGLGGICRVYGVNV